jgi:D-serine deaminase-like pyridoxal phosphate-dependent protein
VVFKHPNLSSFLNAAITCVGAAAVGSAVVAAVTSNPAAGLAIFKPGWKACMITKVNQLVANQFSLEFKVKIITGNWSGH